MNDTEERSLVREAREGDERAERAFAELVRLHQNDLFRLARTLVDSVDDAEDATAETFARAWRSLKGFREDASFKTWLWRILINTSRSVLRRRYLQRKVFFWKKLTDDGDEKIAHDEWIDRSPGADPEASADVKNLRQVVHWARQRLSMREQEVFTLKYDRGLKIAEIAPILRRSPNTVKVLLFRATRKMADALKDYQEPT